MIDTDDRVEHTTSSLNTPARQILAQPCGHGGVFPRGWLANVQVSIADIPQSRLHELIPLELECYLSATQGRQTATLTGRTETLFRGKLARGS